MKGIRESVKIPFSDNRIACIARLLVASRQGRRAKRAPIWANLADAGHVYTMAVIRQQSLERGTFPSSTLLFRKQKQYVIEKAVRLPVPPRILGAVHFFAQKEEVVEYRKNDQKKGATKMKAKKNKRERSAQMQQVSAGLRDVLGMTQWRKEQQISDVGRDRSGGG